MSHRAHRIDVYKAHSPQSDNAHRKSELTNRTHATALVSVKKKVLLK